MKRRTASLVAGTLYWPLGLFLSEHTLANIMLGAMPETKQNFINICKISFNKRYLVYTYICYYPIATFQKAGTCLDAQQSMAKQPIKGCVSNQNRTCGKSVSEKSE